MKYNPKIGIIGGSGVYSFPGLKDVNEINIDTPFGKPSSPILFGKLNEKGIAFLVRHGLNHSIPPSRVNYRANIFALKLLGVKWIISISACGSLREDYAPGDIVVPNQIFDFTKQRKRSFFDDDVVAHIDVANPFCEILRQKIIDGIKLTSAMVHETGTTITIEGPRFSTFAESELFRKWGMSIINMTASPEAFLAREAEICYAIMNHITDYDVWRINEQSVNVDQIINVLKKNIELTYESIGNAIEFLDPDDNCLSENALESALVTNPDSIDFQKNCLSSIISKYKNSFKWGAYWKND